MDTTERLQAILDKQGRTRSWLARKMSVDESTITLLMQGKRRWQDTHRVAAAEALGVPEELIFVGEALAE